MKVLRLKNNISNTRDLGCIRCVGSWLPLLYKWLPLLWHLGCHYFRENLGCLYNVRLWSPPIYRILVTFTMWLNVSAIESLMPPIYETFVSSALWDLCCLYWLPQLCRTFVAWAGCFAIWDLGHFRYIESWLPLLHIRLRPFATSTLLYLSSQNRSKMKACTCFASKQV